MKYCALVSIWDLLLCLRIFLNEFAGCIFLWWYFIPLQTISLILKLFILKIWVKRFIFQIQVGSILLIFLNLFFDVGILVNIRKWVGNRIVVLNIHSLQFCIHVGVSVLLYPNFLFLGHNFNLIIVDLYRHIVVPLKQGVAYFVMVLKMVASIKIGAFTEIIVQIQLWPLLLH